MARLIASDSPQGELDLTLADTAQGGSYRFVVRDNEVHIDPREGGDWYKRITPKERALVFGRILENYRQWSMGDGGFRLAAIGITGTGNAYIHVNTEQLSSDFHRQCAEQNMVSLANDREAHHGAGKPKFKALFLMGGREPSADASSIHVAGPCGNCTDLLAKVMEKDAEIYIHPIPRGEPELPFDGTADPIKLNRRAKVLSEVGRDEIWLTDIEHLNHARVVPLGAARAEAEKGFDALVRRLKEGGAPVTSEIEHKRALFSGERKPSLVDINQLLHESIYEQLRGRLNGYLKRQDAPPLTQHSEQEIRQLILDIVPSVRAVLVRLDDGTCGVGMYSHVQGVDNAAPSAEVAALTDARIAMKLGEHGVTDMWGQEFSPGNILRGVMESSPKEGVERLVKRRAEKVDFHYIPYNDGLPGKRTLEGMTRHFTDRQLSPAYFSGKGDAPKRHGSGQGAVR